MSVIKLFCSTKNKEEQDLKFLSLGQLNSIVDHQSTVDVIKFKSEEQYQEQKKNLHNLYDFRNTKQMLLVINCDNETFKIEKEVSNVSSR